MNKALSKIEEIKHKYPNLRIGQIIASAIPRELEDVFYVTDAELLHHLEDFEQLLDRTIPKN